VWQNLAVPVHEGRIAMSGRAIVIGGSVSGMLAARVLADHFAEVVLFDRDAFPQTGENRKGVPQGQHAHALLSSGRQVLEQYFPGFKDELLGQGAIRGSYQSVRWFDNGVYHTRFDGLEALLVSRPRLEAHLRSRLAALPNVRLIDRADVESLAAENGNVTGVNVRSSTGETHLHTADLVVDASGRGSQSPAWLERMGFPRPHEAAVRVGLAYAIRMYRRKPDHIDSPAAI
jgi:2-polyprenyl-6-methoxyphenol hydroxylase-like FAD-dependent oxidoreductase